MRPLRPSPAVLLLAIAATAASLAAQGTPIGFEETFALSPERAKAVATLIPGSDDWYYWNCRERLDARDFATVRKVVPTWVARHGQNARVEEILRREALLSFGDNRERTFDFLRQRFGYTFAAQPDNPDARPDLPTRLDPAQLSASALTARAFAAHPGTVDGFTDAALPGLLATSLDDDTLNSLLRRLKRPDVDNLPALVVRNLDHRTSSGFGSLPVHNQLRLEQLAECARLRPELLRQRTFVNAWLERLRPDADSSLDDPATRTSHLQGLWQFAQRLPSSFNSLKAHVLHSWLLFDLTQGAPDKDRFLAYIRLPRRSGPIASAYAERFAADEVVDFKAAFPTGLAAIGDDDTPLLRACLRHFFATEDSHEPYAEWLDADWLKAMLAETKLLLGQGDPERWYSLLGDPARLEQIKQRIEITFPATMRTHFGATDAVTIAVDTKNVPTLLVKVFAIDAFRYHVEKQKDVDASIELDGVVATSEQRFTYPEPPLRRVRRTFELPMLKEPGTYVVEFVGNGISSRAVVHKGGLRAVERTAAGGQVFTVFDEAGRQVRDATAWFGGRDYAPDENGEILLPFSTEPATHKLVLRHGNRSALVPFAHRAESYSLAAFAHVEREALVAGRRARILLHPQLRLAGHDVSVKLLAEPVLTVVATDLDGLVTTQEVRTLTLVDEREAVHEIQVPERLQSLQVSLRGKVKDLAGKDVDLASGATAFPVNGIDATPATRSVMLVPTKSGFALEVRGKDGEPRVNRVLAISLRHRDYRDAIDASLQTDARGRIELGTLPGIDAVSVQLDEFRGTFVVPAAMCVWPTALHGRVGDVLRLPYRGTATSPTRARFSLLGQRSDAFTNLALADGFVELRGLAAGNYVLQDHGTGDTVSVKVTLGERQGRWLVGQGRVLESVAEAPLQLRGLEVVGGELVVRVANPTASTRVHVAASRFVPAFDAFEQLAGSPPDEPIAIDTERAESLYEAGRQLGDEYRYVLERRFAAKFPGNMLARPSLLLNPWQIDDSDNEAEGARAGGGKYGSRFGRGSGPGGSPARKPGAGADGPAAGIFASLDYLPRGATTLANLTPDKDGVVRVKVADLGDGQLISVLALDGHQAVRQTLLRDEVPLAPRTRHLPAALDGTQHLIEQKRIEFVAAGATAVLADARAAQVEIQDSLDSAYRLLATISRDGELAKFAFVTQWPAKTDAEKASLYKLYACHELHFFLYQKDRAFFDRVVKPFLQQKLDKTFLDHWLLGDDLATFTAPWQFAQLNLIERILLAQRLDAEGKQAIARGVREALELRPIDVRRLGELFDLALHFEAMDSDRGREVDKLRADHAFMPPRIRDEEPKPPADLAAAAPALDDAAKAPGQPATKGKEPAKELAEKKQAAGEQERDFDAGEWREQAGVAGKKDEELRRRRAAGRLYRAVEKTKLLVESNWWHRRMEASTADVVAPNHFWVDYATAPAGQPFVSAAIVEASGSFLEMMMALSVLDLPFTAGKHEITADDARRTLKAATPLLLVRKEVTKTERAADQAPLLLGQNLFRLDDRYRTENGERRDAFVTDEFLVDVAYGCQVVVTNPTSSRRTAEVLLQIPAGAVPLNKGFWQKGVPVQLEPYATATLEYAFYFPVAGTFAHYPAHAAEKGKLAANAEPHSLKVVLSPSKIDTTSWEHVSQQGSAAEVITFLDGHNVQGLDLSRIAWRMKEREFFTQALAKLRTRHVYDHTLWSYGLLHRDPIATKEHLQHANEFVAQCGMAIESPLLTIEPKERRQFQHIELDPLVHPRAHQLGSQRVIGNQALATQYRALMTLLGYHQKLTADDWLVVTYYLALQDRIEEALATFAKVDAGKVATRVQYDYLAAWLCFFTGDMQKARTLAEAHKDDPVLHWQQRFRDVLSQLDEAAGKASTPTGEPTADLAATAPALELAITDRTINLSYRNLAQCEVRYYELDVEFAFSAQPFAAADGTSAAFVRPNLAETKDLPKGETQVAFALPETFHKKNVLIEVRGGGLVRSKQYFANALNVRFLESYGQVAVTAPDSQAPLPKTYVKVFAKLQNGTVRFHKDGYTDLRGRFDYASLSDDPNANAARYAVLVLDEQRGAVIREVAPPTK